MHYHKRNLLEFHRHPLEHDLLSRHRRAESRRASTLLLDEVYVIKQKRRRTTFVPDP